MVKPFMWRVATNFNFMWYAASAATASHAIVYKSQITWLEVLTCQSSLFDEAGQSISLLHSKLECFAERTATVIGKVEIFQIREKWPLDAPRFIWCGLSHDPVDGNKEYDGWGNASLPSSRLHGEPLWDGVLQDDAAFEHSYQWDDLCWDAIGSQDLPQCFTMYTVKCLLEVNEVNVQGCVPLQTLLNDVA